MEFSKVPKNGKINDDDLRENIYRMEDLENNIMDLTNKTLLCQFLDVRFCIKYVLNDDYACGFEETYLTFTNVLNTQPHITYEELEECYDKFVNGEDLLEDKTYNYDGLEIWMKRKMRIMEEKRKIKEENEERKKTEKKTCECKKCMDIGVVWC